MNAGKHNSCKINPKDSLPYIEVHIKSKEVAYHKYSTFLTQCFRKYSEGDVAIKHTICM